MLPPSPPVRLLVPSSTGGHSDDRIAIHSVSWPPPLIIISVLETSMESFALSMILTYCCQIQLHLWRETWWSVLPSEIQMRFEKSWVLPSERAEKSWERQKLGPPWNRGRSDTLGRLGKLCAPGAGFCSALLPTISLRIFRSSFASSNFCGFHENLSTLTSQIV